MATASIRFDVVSTEEWGGFLYRSVDDDIVDLTSAWTLEGWVKSTQYNGEAFNIGVKGGTSSSNVPFWVECTWHNLGAGYKNNSNARYFTHALPVEEDAWHHIAASYEANVLRLYWDGSLLDTSSAYPDAPVGNAQHFCVAGGHNPNDTYDGVYTALHETQHVKMKEVRLWNVRRTDGQIAAYRDIEAAGNETGLIACYHFNENANDATANALHMSEGLGEGGTDEVSYDTTDFPTLSPASTHLYEMLNETTPDDSDYIYSETPASADVCELLMDTIPDPSGTVTVQVRAWKV